MKKMAVALVLFAMAVYAGADVVPNGHMWFWQDDFGDPYDGYIEASPGDVVTVWHIGNNNGGQWVGLNRIRTELWWDTAVIANPGDGIPDTYIKPIYGDPDPGFGSHVTDPPGHNYSAEPDYSAPQYNHYLKLDFWDSYMWAYEGMVVNGYEIPIRLDAPMGETKLGGRFIGTTDWGGVYWWDEIGDGDPYQLTIKVVGGGVLGDFTGDTPGSPPDGDVDTHDIDELCDNMGSADPTYDLDDGSGTGTPDGVVDANDFNYEIEHLVELSDGIRVGTKAGDFNLDGLVNATDLANMNPNFGGSGMLYADGNANCDDVVNATDLAVLAAAFGYVAPAAAVPEPLSLSLIGVGALVLMRRRK